MGCLFKRAHHSQDFVRALSRSCLDGDKARVADCQRAGLVEHDRVRSRQRFQRPAPLDQDAALGRLGPLGDIRRFRIDLAQSCNAPLRIEAERFDVSPLPDRFVAARD
jgi:hypothetical protein